MKSFEGSHFIIHLSPLHQLCESFSDNIEAWTTSWYLGLTNQHHHLPAPLSLFFLTSLQTPLFLDSHASSLSEISLHWHPFPSFWSRRIPCQDFLLSWHKNSTSFILSIWIYEQRDKNRRMLKALVQEGFNCFKISIMHILCSESRVFELKRCSKWPPLLLIIEHKKFSCFCKHHLNYLRQYLQMPVWV